MFQDEKEEQQLGEGLNNKINSEMLLYFGLPKIPNYQKSHLNPSDWWRDNATHLPHLANTVR